MRIVAHVPTLEFDKETFKVMWEMSAPGRPTERCFLRLSQVEYYHEQFDEPHYLSWMPDVRPVFLFRCHPLTNIL